MKKKNKGGLKKENRPTWAGYKPRKEATKKERIKRAQNKYKGKQEQ